MRGSRKAAAALLLMLAVLVAWWWLKADRHTPGETVPATVDGAAPLPLPDPLERDLQGVPRRGTPGALEVAQ